MSIEAFFDHTCDIYHIQSVGASPGYGLPASPSFSYPDSPDISGLSCHFGVHSASISLNQTDPMNLMNAHIKLGLPKGTDIRVNDKIVWCETGYEYTAEMPRNIRGHHKYVYIKRIDPQMPI